VLLSVRPRDGVQWRPGWPTEDVVYLPAGVFMVVGPGPNPFRRVVRTVLLIKTFPPDARGIASQHQGSIPEILQQIGRNSMVVLKEIRFRQAALWPVGPVKVGDLQFSPGDLNRYPLGQRQSPLRLVRAATTSGSSRSGISVRL